MTRIEADISAAQDAVFQLRNSTTALQTYEQYGTDELLRRELCPSPS